MSKGECYGRFTSGPAERTVRTTSKGALGIGRLADIVAPDHIQQLRARRPIGRAAVRFAADQPDYAVGATLFVDGGVPLSPDFAEGG